MSKEIYDLYLKMGLSEKSLKWRKKQKADLRNVLKN